MTPVLMIRFGRSSSTSYPLALLLAESAPEHDIVWTIEVLRGDGPREAVLHGVRRSLHHVRSLAMNGGPVESRLAKLEREVHRLPSEDLTVAQRTRFIYDLVSVRASLGTMVGFYQRDFKPYPDA